MITNKIIWTKISGAKNSFWMTHFISLTSPFLENQNYSKIAQSMCLKNNIVETDGLVILLPSKKYNFKWLFYNANGSSAEMCGNAACCVIDYVFKKQIFLTDSPYVHFETKSQIIKGDIYKGAARIFLKQNIFSQKKIEVTFNNTKISYQFINSGVPHGVIKLNHWPKSPKQWEPYKSLAKYLRTTTTEHPKGMNISFYSLNNSEGNKNKLYGISFERGIESFTQACGTGALAIAQLHRLNNPDLINIFVSMPGGELEVGFLPPKTLSLISPIKWIQKN